jgi:hypothetical protein
MQETDKMQPRHWVATALAVGLFVGGMGLVWADDDEDGEGRFGRRGPDVAPVSNALYAEECGACHFAYQPGLLPARSWEKLMGGLDNHFGDNAELLPEDAKAITDYLVANAAERSPAYRSVQIARSLPSDAVPLRISEVPYIRHKHREIGARYIQDNPQVKSLARCEACHQTAPKGYYTEGNVRIPGFGSWDD